MQITTKMHVKSACLFVLSTIYFVNAFHHLVPEGKELIYRYATVLRAGTDYSINFQSAFALQGNLHIQSYKNSTFIRFSDITYKLFNGKVGEYDDTAELSLSEEMKAFQNTFQITYDVNGTALGITTEDKEEKYIVNIKKAIGSLFQLDMKVNYFEFNTKNVQAFEAKENTIYGICKTFYNVLSGKDDIVVKKIQEVHPKIEIASKISIENKHCAQYDEPIMRDSIKTYTILKKNDAFVVDSIEVTGEMSYLPYQAESNIYQLNMNQTMYLVSIEDISNKLELKTPNYEQGFTYYLVDVNEISNKFVDFTNGRRHWDMEKAIVEVEKMIHEVVAYLKEHHIQTEPPNIKKGQLINRIKSLMLHMDLQTLEKLTLNMQKIENKDDIFLKVYYGILPLVGTNAALFHIKQLVLDEKIFADDEVLDELQFNIKTPTKELVKEMEGLLYLNDLISFETRKSAIMAFAGILQKAVLKHKSLKAEHNSCNLDLNLYNHYPNETHYEKYITEFGKRLYNAKDYDYKILYLEALHNTKMESALEYLLPVLRGEMLEDKLLQLLAAQAVGSIVRENQDLTYKVFWPMVINAKHSTALRAVAYEMIMNSLPSLARLFKIYLQMNSEKNSALYQFHYKFIQAMSQTEDPCRQLFKHHLKQILRYTVKPEFYGMCGYYNVDYLDHKYGYGEGISSYAVYTSSETEKLFKLTSRKFVNNAITQPLTIILWIDGVEGSLLDNLKLELTNPSRLFNYDKLFENSSMKNKNIKIFISIYKESQSFARLNFDFSNVGNVKEFMTTLQKAYLPLRDKLISMEYPVSKTVMFPTEIGFPATIEEEIPEVTYFDYNITTKIKDDWITYNLDTKLKLWDHGRVGLSFYNPFADAWQGVNKYISRDYAVPLKFGILINVKKQILKFSWNASEEFEDDIIGLKSHVTNMVFIEDNLNNEIINKTSPKLNEYEVITLNDIPRQDIPIYTDSSEFSGLRMIFVEFDTDRYFSDSVEDPEWSSYLNWNNQKDMQTKFKKFILNMWHIENHLYLQPEIGGTHGFMLKIEPSERYSFANVDMSIRFNAKYEHGEMILLPGIGYNLYITYTARSKEKRLLNLNVDANFDTNVGHTKSATNIFFNFTKDNIFPIDNSTYTDEFHLCTEIVYHWFKDKVNATFNFKTNEDQGIQINCTNNNVFNIAMIGEQSLDQKSDKLIYGHCNENIWSNMDFQKSLACYKEHSTIRKFFYNITGIDENDVKADLAKWLRFKYADYISPGLNIYEHDVESNETAFLVEYPMNGDFVDLHIYTSDENNIFKKIPFKLWPLHEMHLGLNLQYSYLFSLMHSLGMTKTCLVKHDSVRSIKNVDVSINVTPEWTMYMGDADIESKHGLWIKKIPKTDKMAIKILHDTKSLEIVPIGKKFEFMVNANKMDDDLNTYSEDWLHYYYSNAQPNVITIISHHLGIHYIYNGYYIQMEMPNIDKQFFGYCFDDK